MTRFNNRISLLIAAAAISVAAWAQPAVKVIATADSTTLVMGDKVNVNVEVLKNGHNGVLVDQPVIRKDYYGLELADASVDSTDLGNNRIQVNYKFTFQAFDPAEVLTLPPFRYAIGTDTISSDILTFKIYPVELPPELGNAESVDSLTINGDEGPVSVRSKWYDYVPTWWIWVVLALLVIGLGVVIFLLYKKNGPSIFVKRMPTPPYELAKQRLVKLRESHLLEKGQVKTYYTDLIDILRNYLEGRFGINAMEMTSKQILKRLRENKETHLSVSQMEQVLQLADFVKFAAANPSPEEGLRTFNTVSDFVESTKPQPEPEEKK